MVEQRQHAESRHPKETYEVCFPAEEEEEGGKKEYVEEYVEEEAAEEEKFAPKNNWVCQATGDVVCNDGYRQSKTHKFAVLSVTVPKNQTGEADIPIHMGFKEMLIPDKKQFMVTMKAYLPKCVAMVKKYANDGDGGDADDVKHF